MTIFKICKQTLDVGDVTRHRQPDLVTSGVPQPRTSPRGAFVVEFSTIFYPVVENRRSTSVKKKHNFCVSTMWLYNRGFMWLNLTSNRRKIVVKLWFNHSEHKREKLKRKMDGYQRKCKFFV